MKYDFIEIGTSDFDTLIESTQGKIGITIEPLLFYLENLPKNPSVIKVNCGFYVISIIQNILDFGKLIHK